MINIIVECIATILDVLFLIWFVPKFNHTSIAKKYWVLIIPTMLIIFQLFGDIFLPGYDLLYSLIFFLFATLYALIICDYKIIRTVFSVCLFMIVTFSVSSLLYMFFSLYINNIDDILQGSDTSARLIFILIGKLSQFAIYKFILIIFRMDDNLDVKNGILVFVFTIMTAVGLGAMMNVAIENQTSLTKTSILIAVCVLAFSNIALYFLIYQVQKLLKSKYELKLLQEKMDFEKSRYEEATVVWDNIRKVRHDIKNHFSVVSGYLKKEDIKSCEEYIEQIMPSVESMGNLIRSNNSVLDYIINSKLAGLKETQIVISGVVSNFDDVEDTDLASIIGNILDNAVEAQEKVTGTKRIELLFRMKNDNRVIICKNAISESVLKTNKELRSTKKNPDDHGLGHQIVETILKKYDGWVDYFESEDMFGVQIMLPMPRK